MRERLGLPDRQDITPVGIYARRLVYPRNNERARLLVLPMWLALFADATNNEWDAACTSAQVPNVAQHRDFLRRVVAGRRIVDVQIDQPYKFITLPTGIDHIDFFTSLMGGMRVDYSVDLDNPETDVLMDSLMNCYCRYDDGQRLYPDQAEDGYFVILLTPLPNFGLIRSEVDKLINYNNGIIE